MIIAGFQCLPHTLSLKAELTSKCILMDIPFLILQGFLFLFYVPISIDHQCRWSVGAYLKRLGHSFIDSFHSSRQHKLQGKIDIPLIYETNVAHCSLVSPRQTAIYVMCPTDHDI
jgi:hypothetical protein